MRKLFYAFLLVLFYLLTPTARISHRNDSAFYDKKVINQLKYFLYLCSNLLKMSVQTEKSLVIDLLQNINDISLLKKVKAFVLTELSPSDLTQEQKNELDKRLDAHKNQNDSNLDAFAFLDELKSKYEL